MELKTNEKDENKIVMINDIKEKLYNSMDMAYLIGVNKTLHPTSNDDKRLKFIRDEISEIINSLIDEKILNKMAYSKGIQDAWKFAKIVSNNFTKSDFDHMNINLLNNDLDEYEYSAKVIESYSYYELKDKVDSWKNKEDN